MATQPPVSAKPFPIARERRQSLERRVGERRRLHLAVPVERRRGPDRRRSMERRESAAGHVRQAIQMLEHMLALQAAGKEIEECARDVTRRLWLALGEIDRLVAACRLLGEQRREQDRAAEGRSSAD